MCTGVISEISEMTTLQERASPRDTQKVPGMVVLHCNGRIYGNAYLITFKVGPLGIHTLAHSILPLLEAPVEKKSQPWRT